MPACAVCYHCQIRESAASAWAVTQFQILEQERVSGFVCAVLRPVPRPTLTCVTPVCVPVAQLARKSGALCGCKCRRVRQSAARCWAICRTNTTSAASTARRQFDSPQGAQRQQRPQV